MKEESSNTASLVETLSLLQHGPRPPRPRPRGVRLRSLRRCR